MKNSQDFEKRVSESNQSSGSGSGIVYFFKLNQSDLKSPSSSTQPRGRNPYPTKTATFSPLKIYLTRLAGCTSSPTLSWIFAIRQEKNYAYPPHQPYCLPLFNANIRIIRLHFTIKNMAFQIEKWQQLPVQPFETVISIKGIQFIYVIHVNDVKEIINCFAFQNTIVTVHNYFAHVILQTRFRSNPDVVPSQMTSYQR